MDTSTAYRELFTNLVGHLGQDFDLARGAFYIAAEDSPTVDVEESTAILDRLAGEVSERLEPSMDLHAKLRTLSRHLGVTLGYSEDKQDSYNPKNLYLDQVLTRKKGVSIALSLVYMEVGARLGILFEPIGLPGSLVMRAASREADIYVDPLHHGKLMSKEDCGNLIGDLLGEKVRLPDEYFQPYTKRKFLVHLLSNLKKIHVRKRNYQGAIAAADRVSLLDPYLGSNLKERAWMFYRTNRFRRAIEDLETYLDIYPVANDANSVRGQIRRLWKTLVSLN